MNRILSSLLTITALGIGITACEQDPNSTGPDSFMDQPKAAKPSTPTTAKPVIVYNNGDTKIFVMDSTGANQTNIYTSTNGRTLSPNWSPADAIVWLERPSSTQASIRAADISVNSSGVPVSSNVRTITSISGGNHNIAVAIWSSTTTTNQIAFDLEAPSSGLGNTYLCRVSASGGTWDTLYTAPHSLLIQGISWSPDDSKIAILLQTRTTTGGYNSFVIINTLTGAVTDSIPVSARVAAGGGNSFEWSRTSTTYSKLVYVANNVINYVTPTSGSTPSTNGIPSTTYDAAISGSLTWSPTNTSVLFIENDYRSGWQPAIFPLMKNKTQTTTLTTLDKEFAVGEMNWHR